MGKTSASAIAVAVIFCGLAWCGASRAAGNPPEKKAEPKKMPLLVMKQDRIEGRVYLLAEGKNEEPTVGNLKVELRSVEDGKLLHETKTDAKGAFVLPSVDVAPYKLVVGRLELALQVQENGNSKAARGIPKQIMVFLPQALAE